MNVWAQKIGPLPMWAWAGVLMGGVLLFMYIQSSRKPATQTATGTGTSQSGSTTPTGTATQGDTQYPASQVPQWVNQTYTTVNPPSEPSVPTSTAGNSQGTPVNASTVNSSAKTQAS